MTIEKIETIEKYIPADEFAESKRIMQGRTLYTINKNMEILEAVTVRCNPSSYDREAIQLFLDNNKYALERYFNDNENNYGISFYECGYNGTAQDEFIKGWKENGVKVV